jgi:hypothetical protein
VEVNMTGFPRILTLVVGTGLIALAAQPAEAAIVRRHIDCFVLAVGVGGLFSTPNQPMSVIVTNGTSATIPADTTYNVTVEGRHMTYRSDAPLAPGGRFTMQVGYVQNSGTCDAYFVDTNYQTGGGTRPKKQNLTRFGQPKTGMFPTN